MAITNSINLPVTENAHSYAKIYASLIKGDFQRRRAYASIVALYSFLNIIEKTSYDIQKSMTLFRNPIINEEYEITDLYVNNWHLDVRVVTGGNAVLIPKKHYDCDITPDYYVVIQVDKELNNASLIGFADTTTIKPEPYNYHYCSVPFTALIPYDLFLDKVKNKKTVKFPAEAHELFQEKYLGIMDHDIDKKIKDKLINHLLNCSECRTEFCCFTGFEMVSSNISKYPDLLNDQTLKIIGAQNLDDEKYKGKEEKILIVDDDSDEDNIKDDTEDNTKDNSEDSPMDNSEDSPKNNSKDNLNDNQDKEEAEEIQDKSLEVIKQEEVKKEETVSDILDELFNIDDIPQEAQQEEKSIDTNIDNSKHNYEDKIDSKQDFEETKTSKIEIDSIIDSDQDLVKIEDEESNSELLNDNAQNNDLQLIDNGSFVNLEEANVEENELQMLNDDHSLSDTEDMQLIPKDDADYGHSGDNDGLVLIDRDESSDIETISSDSTDDETKIEDINTQKVIIDYDETGEPIYSYITNVNQENTNSNTSEIKSIDNDEEIDIMDTLIQPVVISEENANEYENGIDLEEENYSNNNFQTPKVQAENTYIPPVQKEEDTADITSEIEIEDESSIVDIEPEKPEENESYSEPETYTKADIQYDETDNEHTNDSSDEDEIIEEENEEIAIQANEDSEINEIEDTEEEQYEIKEAEEETIIEPQNMWDKNIVKQESEEIDSESAEEEEIEKIDNQEEEISYEPQSEDDSTEEYTEGEEEYYEDEEQEETQSSSKGNKIVAVIISLVVLAGLIGGGIFFFTNNMKNNPNKLVNNEQTENVLDIPNAPDNSNPTPDDEAFGLEIPEEQEQNSMLPGDKTPAGNADIKNDKQEMPIEAPKADKKPTSGDTIELPPLTEKDLLKTEKPKVNQNKKINKSIANAFTLSGNNVSLRGINWFCASELFADNTFKAYLQNLDNILKQNIKNNILNATETPPEDSVTAKFAVDNNNNLQKVIISKSSGSEEIDNIVLQSINETFESEKSPILKDSSLKSDIYYLKVVIKL